MSSQQRTLLRRAVIAVSSIVTAPNPASACLYGEPSVWECIRQMSVAELAVTLVLVGFLTLLVAISATRGRAILRAGRQTRDYESRALTSLYYDRPEEAVSVCALFPHSPVAAVVSSSLLKSFSVRGSTSFRLGSSNPAVRRAVNCPEYRAQAEALGSCGDRVVFAGSGASHRTKLQPL